MLLQPSSFIGHRSRPTLLLHLNSLCRCQLSSAPHTKHIAIGTHASRINRPPIKSEAKIKPASSHPLQNTRHNNIEYNNKWCCITICGEWRKGGLPAHARHSGDIYDSTTSARKMCAHIQTMHQWTMDGPKMKRRLSQVKWALVVIWSNVRLKSFAGGVCFTHTLCGLCTFIVSVFFFSNQQTECGYVNFPKV